VSTDAADRRECLSSGEGGNSRAMNDKPDIDTQQTAETTSADALDEKEAPEFDENNKPGVTDLLKAGKNAMKMLKKQEP
jgi:hypothetical protein